ncbi:MULTISPECIES: glycosyltransferase family 9 protein [Mannheimia]|uniref:Glycosyltransferase family 9 protein n=1 Tax=Mannheimia pernigra TaxID=111844 RepID=A0A7H8UXB7_9PAST|nr:MULTISPECIES: glycosyltransferase family 9 protein [Mannheimia]QLB41057.1 glycosyltransferase family 9 protein [Mannheimia pernigra]QLB45058.1 glycosyltransferase family 9 protein [Mannheimia pernigra]QTM01589.1 lipopolysaccharide heptosyltransferase family protein [Mannheimia sp. ZY171111]
MKLKATLQKLRLSLGKKLIDIEKSKDSSLRLLNKILFLRQDGKIGDYIVSSFVFRELKKYNPNLKIGVVCDKKQAYLFEQNPYIDQCYRVKRKDILDYIQCGKNLCQEQYDVVIDPTVMLRNRDLLLLRLINAKSYIGYKKSDYQIFNISLEQECHFSELYQQALEKLGIVVENMQYDIPYHSTANAEICDFLDQKQLKDYIAINFFGASSSRKINDENMGKYISHLQKIVPNRPLILLSYPDVLEKLKAISKQFDQVFVFDTKHIFHTIELIRYADWLISPDTSTVHIASGLNKKIIALYGDGQENWTHWKPMSKAETHILFYKENINEISPEQIKPEWLN